MIIGIAGKKGVGKTTLADHWTNQYGYAKDSFSGILKHVSNEVWENNINDCPKEARFGEYKWTPREWYIDLGDLVRKYDKDYFVNSLFEMYDEYPYDIPLVIDDVRYPNEYDAITKRKGLIIYIERYKNLNVYKESQDVSETSLDNASFDYVIKPDRNLSLEALYEEGDRFLEGQGLL